ncbi:hypothetical protein ACIQCT_22845 [Enterobacter cancerogenus]|uniref:hypothetical protein n=1 Tax=Enterobacter cancerogenus TaxID=69218 RepID=UPI0037F6B27E
MYRVIDFFYTKQCYRHIKSCLKIYREILRQKGLTDARIYKVDSVINGDDTCNFICELTWKSQAHWEMARNILTENNTLVTSITILHNKVQSLKGTQMIQGQVLSPRCDYHEPMVLFDVIQIKKELNNQYIEMWQHAANYMSSCQGYLSSELISIESSGDITTFVNIARWGSEFYFNNAFNTSDFMSIISGFEPYCSLYLCREIHYDN